MAASPQMIKSALRDWLSGGRSLDSEFHRSGSPLTPIPAHPPARDDDIGERPSRHFDRSEAEWRNLTPPWYRKHWGGRSLDSEFHRSGFPLTPIPAHPPARDDDIGGHPYRHFDRSGAEWRNLTPQWAKKELGFRRWLFRRAALPSLWGREADQSAR